MAEAILAIIAAVIAIVAKMVTGRKKSLRRRVIDEIERSIRARQAKSDVVRATDDYERRKRLERLLRQARGSVRPKR